MSTQLDVNLNVTRCISFSDVDTRVTCTRQLMSVMHLLHKEHGSTVPPEKTRETKIMFS